MKRIVIDGGSYNPVHDAHIFMKDEVQKHTGADEVWMWVSHNPFKNASDYAPPDARMEMCQNAIGDRPWLKVTDMEKHFHDTKTASSLTILKEMFPQTEFIWAFGDDNFNTFDTWNDLRFMIDGEIVFDWQYIMHEFSIAVMHRPGYRADLSGIVAARYAQDLMISDPKQLSAPHIGWCRLDNKTYPYSSTDVRSGLIRRDRNILGLNPENEKIIYDHGLFRLSEQFNAKPLPHEVNNKVRFQTFILLANTANLVKSLWRSDLLNTDPAEYSKHFVISWDKSVAKGDMQKYQDVPGEVADCLISLYWIASDRNIALPPLEQGKENQVSVNQWCENHFPNRSIEQKMMDYLEELAELCVCEGLEKNRAIGIIDEIFQVDDVVSPEVAIQNNFKKLHSYAADMRDYLDNILDNKMKINRERTVQQSSDREERKRRSMQRQPR